MKHGASHKIFEAIMRFKDRGIYKWVYKHPLVSIAMLVIVAVAILYIFVSFVIKYVL